MTFLRQIQPSISPIIQGLKDCLRDIQLMYYILRHSSHIPGLPEEYSWVLPRLGMKFRHTSDPLSCRGWWSQIWHHMHILFTAQFWQAATHYQHMIPLQAHLWTVYTHFAFPLNCTFCSIPSIFLPFWIHWICSCQHTLSVHHTDTEHLGAGEGYPARPQQISEAFLDWYVKAAAKLP